MDTYPCPVCGGPAVAETGCASCGRAHDPLAASLARLNQALADLDEQAAHLAANQTDLSGRRANLRAQQAAITEALTRRIAAESDTRRTNRSGDRMPRQRTAMRSGKTSATAPASAGARAATAGNGNGNGKETSPRSAQNTLLILGSVLLGIAAVVFAGLFYASTQTLGRATVLGGATAAALAVPVLLARQRLTATAEAICALGFLLLFIDGLMAYRSDLLGVRAIAALPAIQLLLAVIAVAAGGYQPLTHLRAPQVVFLLATQPLLPLLGAQVHAGYAASGALFAGLAAQNIGAVVALRRLHQLRPGRALPELAWLLFGLAIAASTSVSAIALIQAQTVVQALAASASLLLAAGVGVAAGSLSTGWLSADPRTADSRTGEHGLVRHFANGAAVLAVFAVLTRVNYLALPDYTVMLTVVLAVGVAVAATALPADLRAGPQAASAVAASLVALVVINSAVRAAVTAIRAALTPSAWSADLIAYPLRLRLTTWQIPASAILLVLVLVLLALAKSAKTATWHTDAASMGAVVAVFAAPATGALAWWVPPLLAVGVCAVVLSAALVARTAHGASTRAWSAGLLGLYAVATSLARPWLTALVCAAIAATAGGLAALAAHRPARFGPYADRIADLAGGAAAFTVPVVVGTCGWLSGADPRVLLPTTVLAAAFGALGSAVASAVMPVRRYGSSIGALAAAGGVTLLSIQLGGTTGVDIALATILFAGTAATVAGDRFRLGDSFAGRPTRMPATGVAIDGVTAGSAIATMVTIVESARLLALAVPGITLVTTCAMVLVVALAVRALPAGWRSGPRLGAGVLGGVIVSAIAVVAMVEAIRSVAAQLPPWSGSTDRWASIATAWAPFGAQVPASLLLAAVAAWALLSKPVAIDIGFVALTMAGLSAPAALRLAWWTPTVIAGTLALVAALTIGLTGRRLTPATLRRRLKFSVVLTSYAVVACAASPVASAVVLGAISAAATLVAWVAYVGQRSQPVVANAATALALAAACGTAASTAVAGGSGRGGALAAVFSTAGLGVFVLAALRLGTPATRSRRYPAFAVGGCAATAAAVSLTDVFTLHPWAALGSLVTASAAATLRPDRVGLRAMVTTLAVPLGLAAAVGSAPVWLDALVGPYRTLRHVWQGAPTVTTEADPSRTMLAMLTLALLAAAAGAIAAGAFGWRYVAAAALPATAGVALLSPVAFGTVAVGAAHPAGTWAALAIALVAGLGAALLPPAAARANYLLRGTAGVVCAVIGATGLVGSLATRSATLTTLWIAGGTAAVCAVLGRETPARVAGWLVMSAAAVALPATSAAAGGHPVRSSLLAIFAVSTGLVLVAGVLAQRWRQRAEAAAAEFGAIGAGIVATAACAGSLRHLAATLTVAGILAGLAALRRDRPTAVRGWLVRAGLVAELASCWLLLYSVKVALPEAYTLPFAALALLAGVIELRREPGLSSWLAYGPALAGGFLPSVALVLIGEDVVWRWMALFVAAILTVIVGAWRRRRAPVVSGTAIVIAVALTEMVRLLLRGAIAGAILVAVAGVALIVAGALAEKRLRGALRTMS